MSQLGDDFKLYWDSANTFGTPTWVEQDCVDDLDIDFSPVAVQINKRGKKHIKYKTGRLDSALNFTLLYDSANAFVTALEAAILSGASLHVAIADGEIATSGTEYWHAEMVITGFPLDASLDEGAAYDVELRVADTTNDPARVTVA